MTLLLPNDPNSKLVSTKVASDISGYNSDYLARLCREEKIVGVHVGRAWIIDRESLLEFIAVQEAKKAERSQELRVSREKEYRRAQKPILKAAQAVVSAGIAARESIAEGSRTTSRDIARRFVQKKNQAAESIRIGYSRPLAAAGVALAVVAGSAFASTRSEFLHAVAGGADIVIALAEDTSPKLISSSSFRVTEENTEVANSVSHAPVLTFALPHATVAANIFADVLGTSVYHALHEQHELTDAARVPFSQTSAGDVASARVALVADIVTHPVASLVNGYVYSGIALYRAGSTVRDGYATGVVTSGDYSLTLAATTRDALAEVPKSTNRILNGYANGVYALTDAAPKSAGTVIMALYDVGSGTNMLAASAPSRVREAKDALANGAVTTSLAIADTVVGAGVSAARPLTPSSLAAAHTNATNTSLGLLGGTAVRLQSLYTGVTSMGSRVVGVPLRAENTVLGMAGFAASVLDGTESTSGLSTIVDHGVVPTVVASAGSAAVQQTPGARALNTLPPATSLTASVVSFSPISWQRAFERLFHTSSMLALNIATSGIRALATLLPGGTVATPVLTIVNTDTETILPSNADAVTQPGGVLVSNSTGASVIQNIVNNYFPQTFVGGAMDELVLAIVRPFVRDSIEAALLTNRRGGGGGSSGGSGGGVNSDGATLTNVTILSGTANLSSVTATTANFGSLTTGTTTINGDLTVNGTITATTLSVANLSSNAAVIAPYFTATSTTATSTFPNLSSTNAVATNLTTTNFGLGGQTFTSLLGAGLSNVGGVLTLSTSTLNLEANFFKQGGNAYGATATLGTTDANPLRFIVNNAVAGTFAVNGFLGLGTTSPSERLSVAGNALISGGLTTATLTTTGAATVNSLSIGSLSGFLKATAGAVSVGLIDLSTDVTSTLPTSKGGTGSTSLSGILVGNGTSPVQTLVIGTPLSFSGNTLSINQAGAASDGYLSSVDWNTFNSKFGTTSANYWLTTKSTSDLAEGTNLYYTDARARAALSFSGTGLSYNSGTGVLSVSGGYTIPLTASTTEWSSAYQNRITSATAPLSITGNVLSISQANSSTNGYLSSTDWSTFNNKISSTSLSGGTGISYNSSTGVITNTGVTSNVAGTGISVSGATGAVTISNTGVLSLQQSFGTAQTGALTLASSTSGNDFSITNTSGVFTFNLPSASATSRGVLTAADWSSFSSKISTSSLSATYPVLYNNVTGVFSLAFGTTTSNTWAGTQIFTNAPVFSSLTGLLVGNGSSALTSATVNAPLSFSGNTLSITQANTSTNGFLSSTDWNTFNNKISSTSLSGGTGISYNSGTGVITNTGVTSNVAGSGISVSGATGAVTITNTGVLSFAQTFGSAQTGAITIASSTTGTDFSITNTGGTFTFNLPSASATSRGLLTSADWSSFSNKISSTSLSAVYPLAYNSSTGVFTTAFSTTTTNIFSALNTFNGGITVTGNTTLANASSTNEFAARLTANTAAFGQTGSTTISSTGALTTPSATIGSLAGLIYGNAGALTSVATSTPTLGLGITYSGTLGSFVGGTSGAFSVATSSLFTGTAGQIPYFTGTNTLGAISTGTGGQVLTWNNGAPQWVATTTYANGTGISTSFAAGQLTITNTGVTSFAQIFGSAQTGAITIASSTAGTDFSITNSAGAFTFNLPSASATSRGLLTSADWTTFNNKFSTTSTDYWLTTKSTSNLAEGSNLYFTNARVASYISSSSTVPHVGGSAYGDILYWTGSSWATRATSTLAVSLTDVTGVLSQAKGGTSFSSYTAGDILYADASAVLQKLPVGTAGQVLKVQGGLPSWGLDQTIGGGGSDGIFATSSGKIYPLDTASVVLVGTNSTSSNSTLFEVNGSSYFSGNVGIGTTTPAAKLAVTGNAFINGNVTTTGSGTFASLSVGSLNGILYGNNGAVTTATISSPLAFSAGTLSITQANTSTNGYLSSTDWNTFNNKLSSTSISGVYPIQYNSGTGAISLAFGTTTSNTWAGTQIFTNAPVLGSLSGLVYGNNGTLAASATSTLAISSAFNYSGTLGSLVGGAGGTLSLATNGVALTNLAQIAANTILGNPTGATGNVQAIATSTLFGTGTGGQVLTWNNGVPQWVATTTYANGTGISTAFAGGQLTITNTGVTSNVAGSGISVSGATGAVTISNTGVLSFAQTYGTAQTGAITIASSTSGNDFSITNTSGAFTFNLPTASETARGLLSSTDWSTFNNKQAALAFTYPLVNSANTISLAFGTTTANSWSALQTFNGGINVTGNTTLANASSTNEFAARLTANTAAFGQTGSTTISSTGALTTPALTIATLNGPLQANNGVVSATSSIGVLYGGTGLTTAPTYGQLLVGNNSGGYTLTATSSLGLLSNAVTSIGPAGQLQNGPTVTFASTTSTTNGVTSVLTITASGNTVTFTPSQSGTLTVAGGGTGSTTLGGLLIGNGTSAVGSAIVSAPLVYSAGTLSITQAASGTNGYLSSTDWNTFNNKISSTSLSGGIGISYNSSTGVITNTGVTSNVAGSGISVSGATGAVTITNTGVLSFAQTFGSAQTGAITIASSTAGTDFSITNSGGTFTFNLPSASATNRGLLTSADWSSFSGKISSTSLSAVYPLAYNSSTGVFTTAFSTTTTNIFSALNTFNGGITTSGTVTLGTLGGVLYGNNGVVNSSATSTPTLASELSYSGTLGSFVGGTSGSLSLTTNGTALNKLVQIGANTILGNPTGATGNVQAFATSSLGIALSDTTGTLTVARGGTGSTTLSGILVGNGTSAINTLTVSSPLTFSGSTLAIQVANGSQNGYLSSTDWSTFNNKQAALAFTYPLVNTSNTVSLAFGTTTSNTWAGTQTFTNAPIFSSLSGLLQGNGNGAVTAIAGTAGQFPYYNGTNTLTATSTLFLSTASNVGIGTTSPYKKFSVAGDFALTGGFFDSLSTAGLNGYVLQSTGTATKWVATSTLGFSSAAGSANQVAYFNGANSLTGSANFTFDGTNLTVTNNVISNAQFLGVGGSGSSGAPSYSFSGDATTGIYHPAGNTIGFATGGVPRAVIDGNGFLGIGSSTPGSILSLGSVANFTTATSTFYSTGGLNLTGGGCYAINGTCLTNSPYTFTYPLVNSSNVISLAFGTTTANTWSVLNTFTGGINVTGNTTLANASSTNEFAARLTANTAAFGQTATSSFAANGALTLSQALGLTSGGTATTTFYNKGLVFSDGVKLTQAKGSGVSTLNWDNTNGYLSIGTLSSTATLTVGGNASITGFYDTPSALGGYKSDGNFALRAYPAATSKSTFVGQFAGANDDGSNSSGAVQNTALGYQASFTNSYSNSGSDNTAVGYQALYSSDAASANTAIGSQSLFFNVGGNNSALGLYSLYSNSTGVNNAALGIYAGRGGTPNTTSFGTYVGSSAGFSVTSGADYNTLVGYQSGYGITTGARNVFLGNSTSTASLNQVTTGSNNISIGNNVAVASATANNQLSIGNLIYGTGLSGTGTTLSTAGRIGIATTTPWAQLSINPNGIGNGPEFVIGSSTSTHLIVTNAGLLGIATTTPGSLLSLGGIANFTTATSSFYSTGGLNLTGGGCFAINGVCVGGSGVTSFAQTFGTAQTGSITIASSTAGTDFSITNSGGTFTFNLPSASATNRGLLTSTDWTTFNNKQAALAFTYPLVNTSNTVSLAFGTTTSNTWAGTQTFTNAPILGSLTGLIYGNSGTLATAATSTLAISSAFNYSGTLGSLVGGAGGTLSLATNGVALSNIAQIGANTILGNPTGATGNVQAFATSSLGIALSDTTGTLAIARGGTNAVSFTTGQPIFFNGTSLVSSSTLTVNVGGTGSTTLGGILVGNGTAAVKSLVVGSGLTFDGTTLATSGAGITSIGPAGQLQTGGTQTLATTTSSFNGLTVGLTITASGNTQTFQPTLAGTLGVGGGGTGLATTPSFGQILVGNGSGYTLTATSSLGLESALTFNAPLTRAGNAVSITQATTGANGYLSSTDFNIFNNKISSTSLSAVYPLAYNSSTGVFTTAFSTTTTNIFSALNTFNGGVTIAALNGPLQANNGVVSATSSIGVLYGGTGLTTAPTYGQLLVGNNSGGYTLTATSSLGLLSNAVTSIGPAGQLQNGPTVTFASTTSTTNGVTSVLTITASGNTVTFTPSQSGTLTVAGGGTGSTTLGGLLIGNGTSAVGSAIVSAPLVYSAGTLSITQAASGTNGYLSSTDWNTFNNKISSTSLSGGIGISYNSSTGVITNTGVTSNVAGSGISVSGATGAVTITNTGVLSFAQTFGSAQTGAITIASSTAGTDFSITNSGGTFTFNLPSASATARGLLTSADWSSFSGKISSTSLSALYPLAYNSSTGVFTTAFSTTTTNTFSALNTFNGGLTIAALNGPLQANNGVVSATSSIGVLYGGTGLTTAPTYGQLLVGNASGGYTLTATSSLGLLSSAITSIGPAGQLQNGPAVTFATTTSTTNGITSALTITASGNVVTFVPSQSGTLTVAGGGTGSTTLGGLLIGNGTSAVGSAIVSAPLVYSAGTLSITQAGSGTNGYLSSTDWNLFNNKISSTSLSGGTGISYSSGTGVITNTGVTSNVAGTGISVSGATGAVTITNTGVLSFQQSFGTAQTGAITIASSTAGTDFSITNSGSAFSFNLPSASATNRGLLTSADWTTFNNKQAALAFTYPLVNTSNTVSLAFGTTTANSWSALQTFNGGITTSGTVTLGTLNGVLYGNSGVVAASGTSTPTLASELSYSGILGSFVGGSSGSLSLTTNGTALNKLVQIAANTILGNPTGATGNVQAFATSSLGIALSDTTGILAVGKGGTGLGTTPAYGQILVGNGSGYTLTATSSLGLLSSAITSIGPTGQLQTGPAITLASTTSTTNGITSALTITASGNTVTFTPSQSGTLTVAGGGTGSTTLGGLLIGNGTSAVGSALVSAPLAYSAGTLSITQANTSTNGYLSSTDWNTFNNKISSTSLSGGTGISYNSGTGVITNTGVTSVQQSFGSAQTGAITYATTSQTTNGQTIGLNITNAAGTFTFAPTISGTLGVAGGGTGLATTPTFGQILVGNGSGYTLTATSSLGLGTVTSVNASGGTTGLSFSGGPITSSGTLTLSGTLGVANGGTGSTTLSGILVGNGTSAVNTLTVSSPLTFSGTTLALQVANGSQNGYLSSTDWSTFNNKISSTSLSAVYPLAYNSSTGVFTTAFGTTTTNTFSALQTFNGGITTSGTVTLGSLSGVLYGNSGVVAASATSTVTNGTGISISGSAAVVGAGGLTITNTGVTSNVAGSGISVSGATGAVTITNNGVIAVGPAGQTSNGTVLFASSTAGTDFTITGSGATITFNLPSASGSNRGLLTSTDWTTFNNKQAALAFTYPLVNTANTVSLAFGTTTANSWSALQTFNGGITVTGNTTLANASSTNEFAARLTANTAAFGQTGSTTISSTGALTTPSLTIGSLSGVLYGNGGAVNAAATSTLSLAPGLSYSGTLGDFIGGSSGSLSIATSSLYTGTTGQFPYFSATNTLTATSSLFLDASGKIGIGSTTPGADLAINGKNGNAYVLNIIGGNGVSTGDLIGAGINLQAGTGKTGGAVANNGGSLNFTAGNGGNGSGSNGSGGSLYLTPGTPGTGGGGAGTVGNVYLAVTQTGVSQGFVGIGTTTPSSLLAVGGNATIGADYNVAAPTNGLLVQGFVGIGTSTPGSLLSIGGIANFTAATSTFYSTGGINLTNGGCFAINGTCVGAGGGSGVSSIAQTFGSAQTGAITFATSSASTFNGLTVSNSITNSGGTFTFGAPTITGTLGVAGGGTGTTTGGVTNGVEYYNGSTLTNSAGFIFTGTNVGIGTTSPGSTLSVAGNAYTSGFYNTSGVSGGYKIDGNLILQASSTLKSTLVGYQAGLLLDDTSFGNSALGYQSLKSAVGAFNNTAVGYQASLNTTGDSNTSLGSSALFTNTAGAENTAIGFQALYTNNTTGNTAVGTRAARSVTTGANNAAFGYESLRNSITGGSNTAIGVFSLYNNTSATSSTALGYSAGRGSGGSYFNQGGTYVGYQSGYSAGNNSDYNTLIGYQSGYGITTGARNVFLGNATISASQNQVTTGSNNISIGNDVAVPSASANNQLSIGNLIYGTGLDGTGATLSSGNIGIGTTTPGSRFSIGSIANFTAATSTFYGTGGLNLTGGGCFAINGVCVGGSGGTTYTGTYPVQVTGSVISLAFGTTTANAWSGLQTFNGGITTSGTVTLGTLSGVLYGNSGVVAASATSTPTLGLGLSYTGTLGSFVGGTSGAFSIATSSLFTGTTGQFPYFSATNTLTATSSIFLASTGNVTIGTNAGFFAAGAAPINALYIGANGNIGLGTSSPTASLSLYNTNTAGASPSITLGGNPNGDTDFWIARQNNNDTTNNDSLQFGLGLTPGTSPLLTLDYTSRVGIGTTTPGSLLSLNGIANFDTATSTFYSTGGLNLTGGGCYAINGSCVGSGSFSNTLASGGTATTTFYSGGVVFSDGSKLTQSSAAANFFWDETNKRLGLGNATPLAKLVIEGASQDPDGGLSIKTGSVDWRAYASTNGAVQNGNGANASLHIGGKNANSEFWIAGFGATVSNAFQSPDSNTGATPLAVLGVSGQTGDLLQVRATRSSTNGDVLTINSAGRLGIGTTSPGSILSVAGTANFGSATSSIYSDLIIGNGTSTPIATNLGAYVSRQGTTGFAVRNSAVGNEAALFAGANGDTSVGSISNNNFKIQTNNTEVARFTTGGNFGIATTAPSEKLSVAGNAMITGLLKGGTGATVNLNGFSNNGVDTNYLNGGIFRSVEYNIKGINDIFFQGLSSGGTGYTFIEDYGGLGLVLDTGGGTAPVIFQINRIEKGRFDSAGNFGLGTTSPGSLLSLNGIANFTTATSTFYSTGGLNLTGGGCFAINGTCLPAAGGAGTPAGSGAELQYRSNGTTFGAITNSAYNVLRGTTGFGTTTPAHLLTLSSSTAPQLALTDGSATSNQWAFRSAGNNLYIGTSSPSTFATSSIPTLTLLNAGQAGLVGIGSSTPWAKFSVELGPTAPGLVVANQGSSTPSFLITSAVQNGIVAIGTSTPSQNHNFVVAGTSYFVGSSTIQNSLNNGFVVGPSINTPTLTINSGTGSGVTGLSITNGTTGGTTALATTDTGANSSLTINGKGTGTIGIGSASTGAITIGNSSTANANYNIISTGTHTIQTGGTARLAITQSAFTLSPAAVSSGVVPHFTFTGAADTALTASTEATNILFNLAQTRQHSTGALTLQRDFRIQPTTHSFVGASTLTTAAAFAIDGPPIGGTNATISTSTALLIGGTGVSSALTANAYGLMVFAPIGATNNYAASFVTGNVGIGTTSPGYLLTLASSTASQLALTDGSATSNQWAFRNATGNLYISTSSPSTYATSSIAAWTIATDGGIVGYNATGGSKGIGTINALNVYANNVQLTSDARYKTNVQNLSTTTGLGLIRALRPVSYNWINPQMGTENQLGFIAQEVQLIAPELVNVGKDAEHTLSLNYIGLISPAVQAIQQLAVQSDSLSLATTTLATRIDALALAMQQGLASTTMPHTLTATEITANSLNIAQGVSAGTLNTQSANVDGTVSAARYVVPNTTSVFNNGSTTITAALPQEALTAGGAVDLYALASYALASTQALAARTDLLSVKIDDIETRLAALETLNAGGVGLGENAQGALGFTVTSLKSVLAQLGIFVENGIAKVNKLVTNQLVLEKGTDGTESTGSEQIVPGATELTISNRLVHTSSKIFITFTSSVNGSWYISEKKEGSFTITLSAAQNTTTSFDYFLLQTDPNAQIAAVGDPGTGTPPPAPPVTQNGGPTLTLNGEAAIEVAQGAAWTDPGATAHAADNTDLTASISVSGGVDMATPGTYTITYHVADSENRVAEVSRIVRVLAPTSGGGGGEPGTGGTVTEGSGSTGGTAGAGGAAGSTGGSTGGEGGGVSSAGGETPPAS